MNQKYMKERPVLGLVLSMSLPMVISMLVNALYNIVDSFYVAKISEEAMTAVSLVYPIQNLISALAIGFGIGVNVVISIALGAGKSRSGSEPGRIAVLCARAGVHDSVHFDHADVSENVYI